MHNGFAYHRNPNFPQRYIRPENLFSYLQQNYAHCIEQIGSSTLGQPIYKMKLGSGKVKVVAWSQMHGNEANSSLAMLDLLESLRFSPGVFEHLFSLISLDFVWMLNPDGALSWSRRNAVNIDMNRDFHQRASKELPLLLNLVMADHYDYALNLHEQRTIFSTDGVHPATLSFLAPSESAERAITLTRQKTMAVIAEIFSRLQGELPHEIARYTDEFYPNSIGDNFTRMGLPCVLFEGGHALGDYQRLKTRKFYTIALYEALLAMGNLMGSTQNWEVYNAIPINKESHFDVIYRNVKLNTSYDCVLDIAVQFREEIGPDDADISFVPIVVEVGDLSKKLGWKEIDCSGKRFCSSTMFPKLDAVVDFSFE